MKDEIKHLSQCAADNCDARGNDLFVKLEAASKDLMLWLDYFNIQKTGIADCLLLGAIASLKECAACLCLGLARPALNAMRLEVDLLLAWLYFKDHRIEWERVGTTGDGFKLKTELMRYFQDAFQKYSSRIGILNQCLTRPIEDPYRLLSAHIHGQSEATLPVVSKLSDVVASAKIQDEVVLLQESCVEYLSDICWCLYADRWASVSAELTTKLKKRFKTPAQQAVFFSQ